MTEIEYIGKCLLVEIDEGKKILIVGDLHLGYEEALNKTGVFMSRKMFDEMINEFDQIFQRIKEISEREKKLSDRTSGLEVNKNVKVNDEGGDVEDNKNSLVDEIVLLGDVKHVFGSVLGQEWGDILKLIDYFIKKMKIGGKIIITKGNHDAILEPITKKRENVELVDYYIIDNILFLHGDKDYEEIWDDKIKWIIMGHVHPAIIIRERDGVKEEKYKCFLSGKYEGKEWIIVPSFAEHSEGIDVRDRDGIKMPWKIDLLKFNVAVVDPLDLETRDFGKLEKLE